MQFGQGTRRYADGGKYIGNFVGDKKEGTGRYEWPNGNVYEGEWLEDQRSGEGSFAWANGESYEGLWKVLFSRHRLSSFHRSHSSNSRMTRNAAMVSDSSTLTQSPHRYLCL